MKSRIAILLALLLALGAFGLGCKSEAADEGTPEDWLADARQSEREGAYYQEDRENAPLGALEYYQKYLDALGDAAPDRDQLVEKVRWLSIIKLMTADHFQGKADYPRAIEALAVFRREYPQSENYAMALFFLGLATEYDIDNPDMAAAIDYYQQFIKANPGHYMVPEVYIRIGHCCEFDLRSPENPGGPKFQEAIEVYDKVVAQFGGDGAAVRAAPLVTRLAVEQALYNKARILESRLVAGAEDEKARAYYSQAAECYRRLTDPVFFGMDPAFYDQARFKKFQFVNFRLGCLLAENLDRKAEGRQVLQEMADRWKESPWYGRIKAKIEEIDKRPDKG